jgi:hypothetical protein
MLLMEGSSLDRMHHRGNSFYRMLPKDGYGGGEMSYNPLQCTTREFLPQDAAPYDWIWLWENTIETITRPECSFGRILP